jgi:hypothetical protein
MAALVASLVWTMSGEGSRRGSHHRQASVLGSGVALGPGVTSGSRATQPGAGSAGPPVPVTPAPRGRAVTVGVDMSHPRAAVPSDFLGLSFEASALPQVVSTTRSSNLAQLLRSLGHGTLRFGGISADTRVAWSQQRALPRWASGVITERDLAGLATLAGQTGWSVLLTVNLGHYDATSAAQEAAAAHALLGSKLAGIEIGNEPDRFFIKGLRGAGWSFSAYRRQFEAYRAAISRAAPGVPIAGPDASSGERVLPWLRASAALQPALLTDHYYPLSRCGYTPSVSDLLGPAIRRGESSMLSSLDAIQR